MALVGVQQLGLYLFSFALNSSSGKYFLSRVSTEESGARLTAAFARESDAYGSSSIGPA